MISLKNYENKKNKKLHINLYINYIIVIYF